MRFGPFFDGVKFAFGMVLVFTILSFSYAVGFHHSNEILPGDFPSGDYSFDGDLTVNHRIGVGVNPSSDLSLHSYSFSFGSNTGDHNSDSFLDSDGGRVYSAYGNKHIGSASLMLEEYDEPFILTGRQTRFQDREDTVLSFYRKKLGLGVTLPQYTFDVNGTQRISTNNSVDYDEPALLLDLRGHAAYPGEDLALKIMMDGDGDSNRDGNFTLGADDVAIEVLSKVSPGDPFSIAYRLWSDGEVFVNKSISIGNMVPNKFSRVSIKSNPSLDFNHSIYSEADMEIVTHNSGNDIEFGFIDKNSGVVTKRAVTISNDGSVNVDGTVTLKKMDIYATGANQFAFRDVLGDLYLINYASCADDTWCCDASSMICLNKKSNSALDAELYINLRNSNSHSCTLLSYEDDSPEYSKGIYYSADMGNNCPVNTNIDPCFSLSKEGDNQFPIHSWGHYQLVCF